MSVSALDPRARTNPFPGLRPFMQEEADLFFGRDRQSDDLVRRLASKRFLAVVGTSGSGKSSLVRAGLLPSLEGGFMAGAGAHWRMAILRPQDDPIGFLAQAIVDTGALAHLDIAAAAASVVETTLRRSSLGLVETVRLARLEPQENLLVLVDQFEELFRFADLPRARNAGNEAPAFVKLLLAAAQQTEVPIYVVLTMRADFLGDCARFRDLPEAISDSQYLIPRLTRDELRAVITGPIGVRGGRIAPSLLQRLLNDVGDDMDQLPVLQHALMRAWDQWERHDPETRSIDLDDLAAIGGMEEALSRHADEAYGALTSDCERTIAERLFKCLTERGSDNREIRRPTPLARIAAIANVDVGEVIPVIDVFRAPGRSFLMPPHGVALDDDAVIDISHESLIRQWGRLRIWVDEEADSRATYLRLVEAARLRRAGKAGLWGEPDLTYARQWQAREAPNATWAERYGRGFDDAGAFLRESEAAHAAELEQERQHADAERMAKERELEQAKALANAQRQRADEQAAARVRQRRFSWALAVLFGLAACAAVYGWQQRRVADERRREAESQRTLALSRQLAARANNEIGRGLQLALLIATAGYRAAPVNDARQMLQRALTAQPQLRTFLSRHHDAVTSVAFSPNGKTLASASSDNTVILWDVESRRPLGEPLKGHQGMVWSVAFSPDGGRLASAGADKTVLLWDVASRTPVGGPLKGHRGTVWSLAFSPDGKTLASAGDDDTVLLWDVASRTAGGEPLKGHLGAVPSVSSVAFSPDGKTLALASSDETVSLWDVASRKPLAEPIEVEERNPFYLSDPDGKRLSLTNPDIARRIRAATVAFSPDGKTLVLAGDDVVLWDIASRTPLGPPLLDDRQGSVHSVAFSPDGKTLATAGRKKTVLLWDVSSRKPLGDPLKGHLSLSLVFSPDGKTLASAGDDKTVILWDVAGRTALAEPLEGHRDRASSVAFSPDGKTLASAGSDGADTVTLWDVVRRTPLGEPLKRHPGLVDSVAFSPDGRTLASTGLTFGTVMWDVARREPLGNPLKGGMSSAFSPDGKTLASASQDGTLILWDVARREPLGEPLSLTLGWSVAFSPDGKTLAASSNDTAILWDMASRKPLGEPLKGHLSAVWSLAFSPDGKTFASAGSDDADAVILWDVASRKPLDEPLKWAGASVAFSPDGKTLASAGAFETVILWDVASRKALGDPLTSHQIGVRSVAFSPDGKTLASAGRDPGVILWDVDVASWMRKACAIANRNLTHKEWAEYTGGDVPYQASCPEFPVPKE